MVNIRRAELIQLRSQGLSWPLIAERLCVSPDALRRYLTLQSLEPRLMRRLPRSNRTSAAVRALQAEGRTRAEMRELLNLNVNQLAAHLWRIRRPEYDREYRQKRRASAAAPGRGPGS